jgi:hypothetical protein
MISDKASITLFSPGRLVINTDPEVQHSRQL